MKSTKKKWYNFKTNQKQPRWFSSTFRLNMSSWGLIVQTHKTHGHGQIWFSVSATLTSVGLSLPTILTGHRTWWPHAVICGLVTGRLGFHISSLTFRTYLPLQPRLLYNSQSSWLSRMSAGVLSTPTSDPLPIDQEGLSVLRNSLSKITLAYASPPTFAT